MWHQRSSSPSLSYKSTENYASPLISISTSSNNSFPSSTTFTDSDLEKSSPILYSPVYYNENFETSPKWKFKSSNKPKILKIFKKNYNKFKIKILNKFSNNYYYKYFKLILINYLINKKSFMLLIIFSTLIISFKQIYSQLAYFNPHNTWIYLDKKPYDFVSDSKVVELIKYIHKNADQHSNYYYNQDGIFDRRVTPALYLNNLIKNFNINNLDESLKLEFSWIDWIDFDQRLLPNIDYLLNHNGLPISNCTQFEIEIGFPKNNYFKKDSLINCTNLNDLEINNLKNMNYPYFKINAPLDNYPLSIEARIIYGATYLYHNFQSPQRLIFIDGLSETDLIIPILNIKSFKNALFPSNLNNDLNLLPIDDLMSNIIKEISFNSDDIFNKDINIIHDIARFNKNLNFDKSKFELNKNDFNNPNNLSEINELLNYNNIFNSLDFNLYSNILNEINNYPNGDYPKYFHEPLLNDKKIGGSHYDWRFFNIKEINNEYKRISNLNRLIRAWLRFSNNENIKTWIAHGTLLGYSFNGFMLPWDFDHDVQVSSTSMWKMAKYFNQSLIIDCTTDDQFSSGYGQYLLDISSNFFNRSNINGNNAIDARFIDIHTGMYIDITQLNNIENKDIILKENIKSFDKVLKKEFYRLLKQKKININQIIKDNDLIGCKNNHFYRFDELNLFERHIFEGEYAYIPSNYASILDREFPNRKTSWKHEGYTWRSNLSMWVLNKRCDGKSFDRIGNSCIEDEYVQLIRDLLFNTYSEEGISDELDEIDEDTRRGVYPDWEAVAGVDLFRAQIGNKR